ncbi:hydrophobic protein OSR8-like [Triticum dicoccoides]|nr:hydrophobic protein OSR8-like [Triticum dicoccoides]
MADEGTANCIDIILAVILPPLGVFFKFACGIEFWICLLLTFFGYLPDIVYAVWVIIGGAPHLCLPLDIVRRVNHTTNDASSKQKNFAKPKEKRPGSLLLLPSLFQKQRNHLFLVQKTARKILN